MTHWSVIFLSWVEVADILACKDAYDVGGVLQCKEELILCDLQDASKLLCNVLVQFLMQDSVSDPFTAVLASFNW